MRLLKFTATFWDRLLSGTSAVGVILLLLLALFITIQVVARYVFNTDIRGLFAYSVSALIIFPLLVAAYTLRNNQHIVVDILTSCLSQRTKVSLSIPVYLVSLVFSITLGWYVGRWAVLCFTIGALKPVERLIIPIPMGVLTGCMTLGLFLLAIETIRRTVVSIRFLASLEGQRREPHQGSQDNPWLWITLFLIGIAIGLGLMIYVSPVVGLLIFVLVLLFFELPVFMSLGLAGIAGLYIVLGNQGLLQAPITAFRAMDSFPLAALPLFIIGGMILERAMIVDNLFKLFQHFAGRFAPSPLLATISVGGFFCAISGSTTAATAVVAAGILPILIKQGYRKTLCCGLVAGSTVGTLIPPSIGFILYGVITGESIGQLFFGGLGPAAVLFSFYFIFVIIRSLVAKKSLFEKGHVPSKISREQLTGKEILSLFRKASWGLFTPVFILGGIYAGVFTPTEAAAVLVIYAIIVTTLVTKTLPWQGMLESLKRATLVSAMLLCIIIGALILAAVVTQLGIAPMLVEFAKSAALGQLEVLGLIFVVIFIMGMFLNGSSVMLISLPVLFPVAQAVGIDAIWLGVFYIIILEVGCLTPPVGQNIFAITGVSGIPLNTVIIGTIPFMGMMLLSVVCMLFFPELVSWLPATMMR